MIVLAAGLTCVVGAQAAFALEMDAVNRAELGDKRAKSTKGPDPILLKAEILLDRARFSPGEIDAKNGGNVRKAIAAFAMAQGLKPDGKLGREVWAKLAASAQDPVLVEYMITDADLKGPFVKDIPSKMENLRVLEHLGYRSPLEALAEKFHMSEGLLKALNPGKAFDRAGEQIVVANVARDAPKEKAASVEIDKAEKVLKALGKDGQLLAVYPASIGSADKPAPSGTLKITSVHRNPTYRYDPKYQFKGVKARRPFTIKPGPNNPVGTVWINLSPGEGYGIHGTPDPGKVSKTQSHGCIRLTNWDAEELAGMVAKGTRVAFLDEATGSGAMAAAAQEDAGMPPPSRHRHGKRRR